MIIRKCDFCGDEAANGVALYKYNGDTVESKRDLCRSCFLKLEAFLKELGYKNA